MWSRKRQLKKRYDSSSTVYDSRYREDQKLKYRRVLPEIENSETLLDVGCGTGMFLEEISDSDKTLFGVDFSVSMLEAAAERVDEAHLFVADADNLPFKDGSFDTVVSLTLLQNMPNPSKTLAEMSRVTQAGGKLVFTVLEKKYSLEEVEDWVSSAELSLLDSEEIPDSEDVFCMARRLK